MVATIQQGAGVQALRHVVVCPPAVGGCFFQGAFSRRSPRSPFEGAEDVEVKVQVLDPSSLQSHLCPGTEDASSSGRHQEPALLWVEEAALSSGFGHVQLSFKLRDAMRTCRLPLKPAKITESRRSNKSESRLAGRAVLSPKHCAVLTQVATVLLPQLTRVLEEAEVHPGVVTGQLQGDPTYDTIYTVLQGRPSVVLLVSDGLMLVGKEATPGTEESFRRALIRPNFVSFELEMVELPAVTGDATASGITSYALPGPLAKGKPIRSLFSADTQFSAGGAGGIEENGCDTVASAAAADMAAAVNRPFTGLTPRSMVQLGSSHLPSGTPTSSLSTAVSVLQSHPSFSKCQAVSLLAAACKAPSLERSSWWAQRSVEAGAIERLVCFHSQVAGAAAGADSSSRLGSPGKAGAAEKAKNRNAAASAAVSTAVLAVVGSAPEGGTSAWVAGRFCSAVRRVLDDVGSSASATLPLLRLVVDAACLPQVAEAAAKSGLAEDLLDRYAEFSRELYGDDPPSSGGRRSKPTREELLAVGNPFSRGEPRNQGRLISHWEEVMWNDEYDSHGRSGASALALGRPAALAPSGAAVPSIPEHGSSGAVNPSEAAPERESSGHRAFGNLPPLDSEASATSLERLNNNSKRSDSLDGDVSLAQTAPGTWRKRPPGVPKLGFGAAAAASGGGGGGGGSGSRGSSPAKPLIPRLSLPSPSGGGSAAPSLRAGGGMSTPLTAGGLTRSSRRIDASSSRTQMSTIRASMLGASLAAGGGGAAPGGVSARDHESTAAEELAALGRNIGEALVAADLGALIGHRRMRVPAHRTSARGSSSSEPATSSPRSPSAGRWGWAGGLLGRTSSKDHHSDSLLGGGSGAGGAAASMEEEGSGGQPALAAKCLILEALLQLEGLGVEAVEGAAAGKGASAASASATAALSRTAAAGMKPSLGLRSPANLLAAELCATGPGDPLRRQAVALLCDGRLRRLVLAASHVLTAAPARRDLLPRPVVALRVRASLALILEQRGPNGGDTATLEAAAVQLEVLREWMAVAASPGLAEQVLDLCGEQLLGVKALLQRWRLATWGRPHLGLMHAFVGLLALLAHHAAQGSPLLGQWLLEVALEPDDCLSLARSYTRSALFGAKDKAPPGVADLSAEELRQMQLTALRYWGSLVQLVGKQPPSAATERRSGNSGGGNSNGGGAPAAMQQQMTSFSGLHTTLVNAGCPVAFSGSDKIMRAAQRSSTALDVTGSVRSTARTSTGSVNGHGDRALTRTDAMSLLSFLVEAPSGLTLRVLEKVQDSTQEAAAGAAGSIHRSALSILASAFAVPGCPVTADPRAVNFYVHYHFLRFVKLYNSGRGGPHLALAKGHLEVLRSLSGCRESHIVRRFYQLRVCDFLVRELSLEFECHHASALSHRSTGTAPPSARSTGSAADHRLSIGGQSQSPVAARSASSCTLPATDRSGTGQLSTRRSMDRPRPSKVPPLRGITDKGQSSGGGGASSEQQQQQQQQHNWQPLVSPKPPLHPVIPKLQGFPTRPGQPVAVVQQQQQQQDPQPGVVSTAAAANGSGFGEVSSYRIDAMDSPLKTSREADEEEAPDSPVSSSSSEEFKTARPAESQTHRSGASSFRTPRLDSEGEPSSSSGPQRLPAGFVFTGDLDEDVAMLEALEAGGGGSLSEDDSDSDSDSDAASSDSDGSAVSAARSPAATLFIPRLQLPTRKGQAASGGSLVELGGPDGAPQEDAGASEDSGRAVPEPLAAEGSLGMLQSQIDMGGKLQLALSQAGSSTRNLSAKGRRTSQAFRGLLRSPSQSKTKEPQAAKREDPSPRPPSNRPPSNRSSLGGDSSLVYADERLLRGLYRDAELHLLILQIVMELLLGQNGQLSPLYTSQNPHDSHKQNIPVLLHHHLNHQDNAWLLPRLLEAAHEQGPSAVMLLRLLAAQLFPSGLYTATQRISRGAYSTVYRCSLPPLGAGTPASVVLKVVDMPESIHDHCNHVDVFNEVSVLHALAGLPGICQLHDFGISGDSFFLVLRDYRCTLLEWRKRQPRAPGPQLRLYLRIFQKVLKALQELHERGVVHFDIKCDNILLQPLEGVSEEDFWHPPSEELPFEVVLADFGESKLCSPGAAPEDVDGDSGEFYGSQLTLRNRGTEYIKSPEMLMVANAQKKGRSSYDRRRQEGAGPPSDVWSAGCLLAEIVLGDWLFYDPDWIRFFIRLTHPGEELLPPERKRDLEELPVVLDLLQFTLIRDPQRRPALQDVGLRCAGLVRAAEGKLEPYRQPPSWVEPTSSMPSVYEAPAVPSSFFASPRAIVGGEPMAAGAFFYDTVPTRVSPGLLLGTADAALRPGALASSGVTHMVLLVRKGAPASAASPAPLLSALAAAAGVRLLECEVPRDDPDPNKRPCAGVGSVLQSSVSFLAEGGGLWGGASAGGEASASAAAASSGRKSTLVVSLSADLAGDASALCCAALMEWLHLGVYEASMLMGWRRLCLGIGPPHLKALALWQDHRRSQVPWLFPAANAAVGTAAPLVVRCPCGAFRAAVLGPHASSGNGNGGGSSSSESGSGAQPVTHTCCKPRSEAPQCPLDCAALTAVLEQQLAASRVDRGATSVHDPAVVSFSASTGIKWASAKAADTHIDPLSPLREASSSSNGSSASVTASNGLSTNPDWKVMQCGCCGYVTHATRGDQLELVCNIEVPAAPAASAVEVLAVAAANSSSAISANSGHKTSRASGPGEKECVLM